MALALALRGGVALPLKLALALKEGECVAQGVAETLSVALPEALSQALRLRAATVNVALALGQAVAVRGAVPEREAEGLPL